MPSSNAPDPTQSARETLIKAIAERRTARILHDASHNSCIRDEILALLNHNVPLSAMSNADLVRIWESFDPSEDPSKGYEAPSVDLDVLR